MSEQTPLLKDTKQVSCKLQKTACCSFKNDDQRCCSSKNNTRTTTCLPQTNDDDFCYLSEQKFEYKLIAFMCAIFLAGMKKKSIYYEKKKTYHTDIFS